MNTTLPKAVLNSFFSSNYFPFPLFFIVAVSKYVKIEGKSLSLVKLIFEKVNYSHWECTSVPGNLCTTLYEPTYYTVDSFINDCILKLKSTITAVKR